MNTANKKESVVLVYCLLIYGATSHPASKASLKNPSEMECLAADSDSLIWFNQYEAEDMRLNFIRLEVLKISETGVWLLLGGPWPLPDLLVLVSEVGVMLPAIFGLGVVDPLVGMESLLGGLALEDLSLLEKSRTPTLLLTLVPLKMKIKFC